MRIGITGTEGFLGSSLATFLAEQPGVFVRPLNRSVENLNDEASLEPFVSECDAVVHFAGKTRASEDELLMSNVSATWHLARALSRQGRTIPLVFSSSLYVYPFADKAYTEEDSPRPESVYGFAKVCAEQAIAQQCESYAVLRFGNVYGAAAKPNYTSVVATFLDRIRRGEPLTINGNGKTKRSQLSITDALSAVWTVVEHLSAAPQRMTCIVAGEPPTSLNDLVDLLRKVVDPNLRVERVPSSQDERASLYASSARFRAATGWRPAVSLEDGLREMWRELTELKKRT